MTRISEEVLRVLAECECSGSELYLRSTLDRKLYLATNKVLDGLGAHWDRARGAHLFPAEINAGLRIEDALVTGTYERPENFDFFPTPELLAREVVRLAQLQPGMRVLEPSAGDGALCKVMIGEPVDGSRCDPWDIACFEIRDDLRAHLHGNGFATFMPCNDFIAARWCDQPGFVPFDRVVMNPPFSKRQDLHHVTEALSYLKPDGLLVAITAAGIEFRTDKKTAALRSLIAERGGSITRNPEGSFKPSGTNVNTVTVGIPGSEARP